MKLSTRRDIEAPQAFVFDCLADFDSWERAAIRQGAEVRRSEGSGAAGTSWSVRFAYRGRPRAVTIVLGEMLAPLKLGLTLTSVSLDGLSEMETMPLSPRRTRLIIGMTIKPKTLAARLFLHSLKLARGRLQRRLEARIASVSGDIEDRYRRSQLASVR